MSKWRVVLLGAVLLPAMCAASVVLAGPEPQVAVEVRLVEVSRDWRQRVSELDLDIDQLEGQIATVEAVVGTEYDDGRARATLGMLEGNLAAKRRALRDAKNLSRLDDAHKKDKKIGPQYQVLLAAWQRYRSIIGVLFAFNPNLGLYVATRNMSTPQRAKTLVRARVSLNMFFVQQAILIGMLHAALFARQSLGGGGCFPAGMLVLMADGSYRRIETLKTGDMVMSMDREAGLARPARIADTTTAWESLVFEFDDGLLTNAAHRFYTHEGLKAAAELEPGDILATRTGAVELSGKGRVMPGRLASSEMQTPLIAVYNILVEGSHTFYISADGENSYLVHDQCACGDEEVAHEAQ